MDNLIKQIVYYVGLVLFTLYTINSFHEYFNKKEIVADIIKLKKDKVIIEFSNNDKTITKNIRINSSIYKAIKNKNKIIIYYDNYILEKINFKDKPPYFTGKLIFNIVILLIFLSPIFFNMSTIIHEIQNRKKKFLE